MRIVSIFMKFGLKFYQVLRRTRGALRNTKSLDIQKYQGFVV
jgi:hypothetical protein